MVILAPGLRHRVRIDQCVVASGIPGKVVFTKDNLSVEVDEVPHFKVVDLQRTIVFQAEAERERRAKVILADGVLQASHELAEAARIPGRQPRALQLR